MEVNLPNFLLPGNMSSVTHSIPSNTRFTAELVACSKTGIYATAENSKYRVILKKVSFGIFRTFLVSKEKKILL